MLILSNTTDNIQIVLGGAVTANQLQCVASWRDISYTPSDSFVPGRTVVNSNDTTDVNLVAAPTSSTYRVVDYLSVYNSDSADAVLTVKFDANSAEYILWKGTLLSTQTLTYTDANGFSVSSAGGVASVFTLASGSPPSSPSAGYLSFFVSTLASRQNFFYKSSLGFNLPIQEALYETPFSLWSPSSAAGVYLGTNGSNLGTAAAVPGNRQYRMVG